MLARWPLDPTWQQLREAFSQLAAQQMSEPLAEDGRELVRGSRYGGRRRILRRLELGLVNPLEVEDASPVSAALAELDRWSLRLVEKEEARARARRSYAIGKWGRIPRWVEHGMGARLERARQVRHRVQMLLGVASAHSVLPLELKPAHSVGDPLVQHLDDLEQEAEDKGGVQMVLRSAAQHGTRSCHTPDPPQACRVGTWAVLAAGPREWCRESVRPA